jgi:hypothetical protein
MQGELTTDQILSLVVGLERCNDDLVVESSLLREIKIPSRYHEHVVNLRDHIHCLIEEYDYIQSPVFLRAISGRSPEFRTMKANYEKQPEKRSAHARAFSDALLAIRHGDSAYDLLCPSQHHRLNAIREVLDTLDGLSSSAT